MTLILRQRLPTNYIQGFAYTWQGTAALLVAAGQCRDDTDSFDIVFSGSWLYTSTIAPGDAISANTFPFIFVWADSTGALAPCVTIATSQLFPSVPTGYDLKRLIGTVRVNSLGEFQAFSMVKSSSALREIHHTVEQPVVNVVSGAVAVVWTALAVSAFVPPNATLALLMVRMSSVNVNNCAAFRPAGDVPNTPPQRVYAGATTGGTANSCDTFYMRPGASGIEYRNATSMVIDMWVLGFVFQL